MPDGPSRYPPAGAEGPDIVHVSSLDVDQARSLLNRFFCPVAVGTPEGRSGFALGAELIRLGPLTVGQLSFATAATFHAAELEAYHVSIPMAGRVRIRHEGQEVIATPATAALLGPGCGAYAAHDANSAVLTVKIEKTALEEELAGLLGHPVEGPIDLSPTITLTEGPGQSWSRLIRLLRDELDYTESLLYQPLIAEQLRSCVLSGLLLSVPHKYLDELSGPPTAGPPRAIRRAVEAIHDDPERAFAVADLARFANMSVRSLQEGFRRHVGVAPMTYLQSVRLDRAHESLRRADSARVTVAAIAHRWGFAHLGRFASAYRLRFGESPSETLRKDG